MAKSTSHTTVYITEHNTMSPVNPITTETPHDDHANEYGFWVNTEHTMTGENSRNLDTLEDNRREISSKSSKRKQTAAVMSQDQNHNFVTLDRQNQRSILPTIPYITYAATTIPSAISPMQAAIVTIASPLNPNNNNPPAAPSFPALYSAPMQSVILSNDNLLSDNFGDHSEPMSKRPKVSTIPFSHDQTQTESSLPQSSTDSIGFSQSIPCSYATDFEYSMDLELNARLAAEEDKRRRNTAASARFRIKKKMREQTLEQTAKDMTAKAEMLEGRVKELELEIKWLRSLIVEKNPRLLDIERSTITEKKGQKTANTTSSPPPSPTLAACKKTADATSSSLPSPSSSSPTTTDDEVIEKSPRQDPVDPKTA